MKQIITFGEVLMRLSPKENKKFMQANLLKFYFGGTAVNARISVVNINNMKSL
jgi:2-dehydro-3-deoxygluconokinase